MQQSDNFPRMSPISISTKIHSVVLKLLCVCIKTVTSTSDLQRSECTLKKKTGERSLNSTDTYYVKLSMNQTSPTLKCSHEVTSNGKKFPDLLE